MHLSSKINMFNLTRFGSKSVFGCFQLSRMSTAIHPSALSSIKKVSINKLYGKYATNFQPENETEVKKVMNYIVKSGIQLDESIAQAAHYKNYTWNQETLKVRPEKRTQGIINGKLSGKAYGHASLKYQAEQAWRDLIIKSKVEDEQNLIRDLNDLGLSLPWSIISCYLVKDFDPSNPRYPVTVFDKVIRTPAIYKTGKLSKAEKDAITEYFESNPVPNLDEAAKLFNRPRRIFLAMVDHHKYQSSRKHFTIEDDKMIMSLYFNGNIPQTRFDLKNCKFHRNEKFLKAIGKSRIGIHSRWENVILPTLGAHLDNKLDELFQLKSKLYEVVIKEKLVTIQDLDIENLLKQIPYINRGFIRSSFAELFDSMKKEPGPLYEHCIAYMKKNIGQVRFSEDYKSSRLAIVEAFESIKSENV